MEEKGLPVIKNSKSVDKFTIARPPPPPDKCLLFYGGQVGPFIVKTPIFTTLSIVSLVKGLHCGRNAVHCQGRLL